MLSDLGYVLDAFTIYIERCHIIWVDNESLSMFVEWNYKFLNFVIETSNWEIFDWAGYLLLSYLIILYLFLLEIINEMIMGFGLIVEKVHKNGVLINECNRDERSCILLVSLGRVI